MHLLHNCAMIIRKKCKVANEFISAVKDLMVRTSKYSDFVTTVCKLLPVVFTRWNKWAEAPIWYFNNYFEFETYFCKKLHNNEKIKSVTVINLLNNGKFLIITSNYKKLYEETKFGLNEILDIKAAESIFKELRFYEDPPPKIGEYVKRRLVKNDLMNT